MTLLQIVIDYALNLNTGVIISAFSVLYGLFKKGAGRLIKANDIQRMKFEAMLHANYLRMNGDAEKWKEDYEAHLENSMREKQYIDS